MIKYYSEIKDYEPLSVGKRHWYANYLSDRSKNKTIRVDIINGFVKVVQQIKNTQLWPILVFTLKTHSAPGK